MSQVAVIAGYGSGISAAVAKRAGAAGYKLALLARTQARLDAAAKGFAESGVTAKGYSVDLTNAEAVKAGIATIQKDLGPVQLVFWNPYGNAAPIQTATEEDVNKSFAVAVTGLVAAVQASLDDLKATKGAVLVTGGGLGLEQDVVVQLAEDWGAATLAIAKAAQRKLVNHLHVALGKEGVYVAEVTVTGLVRGTAFDPESKSPLTAESIAEEFWGLLEKRDPKLWFVIKSE